MTDMELILIRQEFEVRFAIEVDRIMNELSATLDREYIKFRKRWEAIDRSMESANDN